MGWHDCLVVKEARDPLGLLRVGGSGWAWRSAEDVRESGSERERGLVFTSLARSFYGGATGGKGVRRREQNKSITSEIPVIILLRIKSRGQSFHQRE